MVNEPEDLASAMNRVNSPLGKARVAAFKELMEHIAAKMPGKDRAGFRAEHALAVLIGMNLSCMLGKCIAETVLGLAISDGKAFLNETKTNLVDLWTHGICPPSLGMAAE
jgi:hypothetical protein